MLPSDTTAAILLLYLMFRLYVLSIQKRVIIQSETNLKNEKKKITRGSFRYLLRFVTTVLDCVTCEYSPKRVLYILYYNI